MVRKLKMVLALTCIGLLAGCSIQHNTGISPAGNIHFNFVSEDEKLEIEQCAAAKAAKPVHVLAYFDDDSSPNVGVGTWFVAPDESAAYFLTNAHVVSRQYTFDSWDDVKNKPHTVDIVHTGAEGVEGKVVYASLKVAPFKNYLKDYSSHLELSDIAIIKVDKLPEHFKGKVTQHKIAKEMPKSVLQFHSMLPRVDKNTKKLVSTHHYKCLPYLTDGITAYLLDDHSTATKGHSGSSGLNNNGEIAALLRGTSQHYTFKSYVGHLLPTHKDLPFRVRYMNKYDDHEGQLYGVAVHLNDINTAIENYFGKP